MVLDVEDEEVVGLEYVVDFGVGLWLIGEEYGVELVGYEVEVCVFEG